MSCSVDLAREVVIFFEDLSLVPYQDPIGLWTVGYGRLIGKEKPDFTSITESDARFMLAQDLGHAQESVRRLCPGIEEQVHHEAAFISWTFNLGVGNLAASTMLRKWLAGDYERTAKEISRWIYAGGRILPGLVFRREAERALFLGAAVADILDVARSRQAARG